MTRYTQTIQFKVISLLKDTKLNSRKTKVNEQMPTEFDQFHVQMIDKISTLKHVSTMILQ
jgi:hypothetical protein